MQVAGDTTYLILDQTGEFYDRERLLLCLNHLVSEEAAASSGGSSGSTGAPGGQSDQVSGEAADAARRRLKQLNETPQFVSLKDDAAPTDARVRKKRRKGAKRGGKGRC